MENPIICKTEESDIPTNRREKSYLNQSTHKIVLKD